MRLDDRDPQGQPANWLEVILLVVMIIGVLVIVAMGGAIMGVPMK